MAPARVLFFVLALRFFDGTILDLVDGDSRRNARGNFVRSLPGG